MNKNNYYYRLGLSVEKYEGDPTVLEKYVEKLATDLSSKNSLTEQQWGQANIPEIKKAIQNPVEWKKIFDDFVKEKNKDIINALILVSTDNVLSENALAEVARNNEVSERYVRELAEKRGMSVGESAGDPDVDEYTIKLSDYELEGKSATQLKAVQKQITELTYENLYQLLNDEFDGLSLTATSDADAVLGAINNLKDKWQKKSNTKKEIQQRKSNIGKITSGMISFFKEQSAPIEIYRRFLIWDQLNQILQRHFQELKKYKQEQLNDEVFNQYVDELRGVSGDISAKDARSVVYNYFKERNIAIVKPPRDRAICPFCHGSFKKPSSLPDNCPVCRRSLKIKCPKCGKSRNILETPVCDGIELLRYPILEEKLKKAYELTDQIKLVEARFILDEIDEEWKDFPGIDGVRKKYDTVNAGISVAIKKIEACCEDSRYVEAKREVEKYAVSYPDLKTRFNNVYEVLEEIRKQKELYKKETAPDKKEAIAFRLSDIVTDDMEINSWLPALEGVKSVRVIHDGKGRVNIEWTSKNKPNSVDYCLRRKADSAPVNVDDGEEIIGGTKSMSGTDTLPEEGRAYYYCVYAVRGNTKSPICCSQPIVWLKAVEARLSIREDGVDVLWDPIKEEICVAWSEKPLSEPGKGNVVENVSQQGCRIDGLEKGKTYYLYLYKTREIFGKKFYSEGLRLSFVPVEKVDFPKVSKAVGQEKDEYLITHNNYKPGCDLQFFFSQSESIQIPQKHESMFSEIREKLQPMAAEKLSDEQYKVKLSGAKKLYLYPMVVRGGTAFVGNMIVLLQVEALKVTDVGVSGNRMYLRIDAWPEKADRLAVCYSSDEYPADTKDGDYKDIIFKKSFDSDGVLYLKTYKSMEYHFSFFALRDGEFIPVGNYYHNAVVGGGKILVKYEFTTSIMGNLTLKLSVDSGTLPGFDLVLKDGGMPLSDSDGQKAMLERAGVSSDGKDYSFKVKGFKVKSGYYGKIFSKDGDAEFKINGKYKLK